MALLAPGRRKAACCAPPARPISWQACARKVILEQVTIRSQRGLRPPPCCCLGGCWKVWTSAATLPGVTCACGPWLPFDVFTGASCLDRCWCWCCGGGSGGGTGEPAALLEPVVVRPHGDDEPDFSAAAPAAAEPASEEAVLRIGCELPAGRRPARHVSGPCSCVELADADVLRSVLSGAGATSGFCAILETSMRPVKEDIGVGLVDLADSSDGIAGGSAGTATGGS